MEDVTTQDQQRLNRFSRLNEQLNMLEEQIATTEMEADAAKEANSELLLTESPIVRIRVGDLFVHADPTDEQFLALLEEREAFLVNELADLHTRRSALLAECSQLKTALYARFRDTVNLER